ncbi:MAG: hypothetical protein LBH18_03590 [Spirochaetaceae bacterium]|jgi:hypothetical protein|nr:hypothetical protein [Spirochaetaceae bacterium]
MNYEYKLFVKKSLVMGGGGGFNGKFRVSAACCCPAAKRGDLYTEPKERRFAVPVNVILLIADSIIRLPGKIKHQVDAKARLPAGAMTVILRNA